MENNYYLTTMTSGAVSGASHTGCTNLSEKALKSCADMLGASFSDNSDATLNEGYPVFAWQITPDPFEGTGTSKNPYQIKSADNLNELASLINSAYFGDTYRSAYYIQVNHIDLSDSDWAPIGISKEGFQGSYDGKEHSIKGLKLSSETQNSGLFGIVSGEAIIRNVAVYGDVSSTGDNVGGIAGEIQYGASIVDCAYIGMVNGQKNVGGLAGRIWDSGAIFNCYSYGEISGDFNVGGITGAIECSNGSGMIKNCYHAGNVAGATDSTGGIAGIVNCDLTTGNAVTLKNSYYLKTSASTGFNGDAIIEDCTGVPQNVLKKLAEDLGTPYVDNVSPMFLEGYPCFS